MPVYNTGHYLDDSVGSVLRQVYNDYELILIDDASEDDETRKKLTEYEKNDERIRCIRCKEHVGAANARNRGIDESKGDFIIFLDSDDYFDPELILDCHTQATKYDADIVFYNYWHFSSDTICSERYYKRDQSFYDKYAEKVFDAGQYENSDIFLYGFATGTKFFRKSLVIDNNIRFQNLKRQNDIYFSLISMLYAKKSIFVNEDRILLHARIHDMKERISAIPRPECGYLAVCSVLERIKNDGVLNEFSKTISRAVVHIIYNSLNQCRYDDVLGSDFYNYMKHEGISHLVKLFGESLCNVTGSFIGLKSAFEQNYKEKWWMDYDQYIWTLEMLGNEKTISNLRKSDRVVVWGVGVTGRKILHICKSIGIKIYKAVDKSDLLWGTSFEGIVIENPSCLDGNCTIVTGNRDVANSVSDDYKMCEVLLWEPIRY